MTDDEYELDADDLDGMHEDLRAYLTASDFVRDPDLAREMTARLLITLRHAAEDMGMFALVLRRQPGMAETVASYLEQRAEWSLLAESDDDV